MDIKNLQEFSPPGYFNLSEDSTELTKKIFDWFLNFKNSLRDSANNFDNFYRLFLSRNYTDSDSTDFLNLNLERHGLKNITLSPEKLKKVLIWVSTPKKKRLSENLQEFVDFLFSIDWITNFEYIKVGYSSPGKYAEIFIMFSDSLTLPATPSPQAYIPKKWLVPNGWKKIPANSNYYVRGYLDGANIVWSSPVLTSQVIIFKSVSTILDLPLTPSVYDICIVGNDGSLDHNSVYYYDGFVWKKNNTANELQGEVGVNNAYDSSIVYAPPETDLISSDSKPPVDGFSKGFGFYGIRGLGTIARFIVFTLTMTEDGNKNLGLIIQLIKKIKPIGSLTFYINIVYEETTTQILIKDYNSIY